jgi:ATP-dependent Clp endopeptidase proteolytic subunit ClpP
MPIGVPRVPHRLPGESTSQWLDIYNKLYRERTLFLGEEIDDELANQLVGIMLFLNTEDSTRRLFLYINSPGGSVLGGFAIFDAIHHGATRWRIKLALIYKFFLFLHGNRTERIIGFDSLEMSVSHLDDLTYVGWYLL